MLMVYVIDKTCWHEVSGILVNAVNCDIKLVGMMISGIIGNVLEPLWIVTKTLKVHR